MPRKIIDPSELLDNLPNDMADLLQPMIFSPEQVPHLAGKRVVLSCGKIIEIPTDVEMEETKCGNYIKLFAHGLLCYASINQGNKAFVFDIAAIFETEAPADPEPMVLLDRMQAAEARVAELEAEVAWYRGRLEAMPTAFINSWTTAWNSWRKWVSETFNKDGTPLGAPKEAAE